MGLYAQQTAFVNASGTGDTAVVAAIAGRRIRVLGFVVVATIANAVHFRSGTTPISATFPLGANGGVSAAISADDSKGWFRTEPGAALNINMSVATATGVHVVFLVEP